MPRVIDLTWPLVPGTKGVAMEPRFTVARDGWNAADWRLYSHAGTHMDAPVHFGASLATIDQTPLAACFGPAWIARIPRIGPRALLQVSDLGPVATTLRAGDSLLLQSGWSRHVDNSAIYRDALPRISEELARWCVARRVRILGVEPPSVADVHNREEVTRIHRILLEGGVTIVEGLAHLDQLTQERVFFGAVPLKLFGGDGSPVRAFAVEGISPEGWCEV